MDDPTSKVPMAFLLYSTILTISLAFYGLGRRIKETNLIKEEDNKEATEDNSQKKDKSSKASKHRKSQLELDIEEDTKFNNIMDN